VDAAGNLSAASNDAEVAFTVHDDFQGRGIGTFLLEKLVSIARKNGIAAFTADVLADNSAMMQVFHSVGAKIEAKLDGGAYHLRFELTGLSPRVAPADTIAPSN